MKPRAAWPVLAKKAKEKSLEATVAVVKSRERIVHLQQSIERMQKLHADYVARSLEAEKNLTTMSEAMNHRGFLQQISTLISRVEIDLNHAKQELEINKNALQLAEKKNVSKWKHCKSKMYDASKKQPLSASSAKWMLQA